MQNPVIHFRRLLVALVLCALSGCAAPHVHHDAETRSSLSGHLLIIGGGLDDDSRPIYERFVQLASAGGRTPSILVATAASGDEPGNAAGKIEALRVYVPNARIGMIGRETGADDAVGLIDAATAMLFTGGDQKRITAKYRPGGIDGAEAQAMRRLLARGGVIAGCSAGDAMMSDPMFLTGRSSDALGIPTMREGAIMGAQIGTGMGFLPFAMSESHFFERHRFGRLVAGLEAAGRRFGIGVGEDAAVEVDVGAQTITSVGVSDALVVDVGGMVREGLERRNIRAKVLGQGMSIRLSDAIPVPGMVRASDGPMEEIAVVEEGQNRQLASWRFFRRAERSGSPPLILRLEGYEQIGEPDGRGWSVVGIRGRDGVGK